MKAPHTLVLATAIVATFAPLRAAVDLTPSTSTYEVEGLRFPCVVFRDGGTRIQYQPPTGWQLSGGGSRLRLSPADRALAEGFIEILPGTADLSKADETLGRLAAAVLPRDAEKVESLGMSVNPLRIEQADTVEFTLRFSQYGVGYQTSVLLMRRGSELWRFTFTARAAEFSRIHELYRSSLYSIQTLR